MGEVTDSVSVGRASPAAPVATAPSLPDLVQPDAAGDWTALLDTAPSQVAPPGAPIRPSNQPQLQALVLLQTQALPRNAASVALEPLSKGSSPDAGTSTKATGGAAAKALAARQFQRVRQLYAEVDEPSKLISIVG
jgi:hypothetical protein